MGCNCTIYACLGFIDQFNNCPEFLTLDLEADETATWPWKYEFNGRWFGGAIDVTSGSDIILPWVFNEQYIHLIEFYKSDGTLFNDTCYKLNTSKVAGTYTSANVVADNYLNVTLTAEMLSTGESGQVVTIPAIAGNTIIGIGDGNQFYSGASFSQSGDAFTMLNGASFYAGQVITLLYAT